MYAIECSDSKRWISVDQLVFDRMIENGTKKGNH